jgi:hypothetical protein
MLEQQRHAYATNRLGALFKELVLQVMHQQKHPHKNKWH